MPTGSTYVTPDDWATASPFSPVSGARLNKLAEGVHYNFLRHQCGTVTLSFSAVGFVAGSVTFPTAFATTPVVVVSGQENAGVSDIVVTVTARTTTSFSYRAASKTGAAITATVTLLWIAQRP